jgi:hypothetical protein
MTFKSMTRASCLFVLGVGTGWLARTVSPAQVDLEALTIGVEEARGKNHSLSDYSFLLLSIGKVLKECDAREKLDVQTVNALNESLEEVNVSKINKLLTKKL